ncbi:MAG: FKBP-type peptidyl-prolyl cis-trans isomerase [Candidatus Liptonbacteria bacterium]
MKIVGGIIVVLVVLIIFGQGQGWIGTGSGDKQTAIITQENGLIIKDLELGTGAAAEPGNVLLVHYTGTLMNGTQFDSSYQRQEPFRFQLGAGQVIRGWEEGFEGMRVGGKRELTIPPSLGYGPNAVGPIPPDSILKFVVELVKIESK